MNFSKPLSFFSQNRGNLLFVLLFIVIILQVVQLVRSKNPTPAVSVVPLASTTPVEIFSSQTATIRGKVTAINGTNLTLENDQKVMGNFDAGKVVLVNDATNLTVASSSADLQKIQLNKDTLINLLYTNGRYVITSLTYR